MRIEKDKRSRVHERRGNRGKMRRGIWKRGGKYIEIK